jgi:hypothetical protein
VAAQGILREHMEAETAKLTSSRMQRERKNLGPNILFKGTPQFA